MLRFEGPIAGGGLPQCSVLRCVSEGAYLAILDAGPRVERPMCSEHKRRIDAGERWQWDAEQSVFLMGSDLSGEGRLSVARFTVNRRSDVDSELGAWPIRVDIEDSGGTSLGLVMSTEHARELGSLLARFGEH